LKLIGKEHQI